MIRSRTRVGILGCGAIGSEVARAIDSDISDLLLAALCDIVEAKALDLRDTLGSSRPEIVVAGRLIEECDLILEAAAASAVPGFVPDAVKLGKTVVVMSVGGIAEIDGGFLAEIDSFPGKIIVPSGAIGGIDAILAMKESGIDEATLTTRKPPASLGRTDLTETVVFSGDARQAVRAFPRNINVAMTLSLALGPDVPLGVRIISDPGVSRNTHTIEVTGGAGRLTITCENVPHPDNPATSRLAPLSAIAVFKKLAAGLAVGT